LGQPVWKAVLWAERARPLFLLNGEARRETGNIISGDLFLAAVCVRLYIRHFKEN